MSETLRELVAQSQNIAAALVESGGELTPEMEAALIEIDTKMPTKIDGYAMVMERLELESEYWNAKSAQFAQIAKGCLNARKRLRDSIEYAMTQLTTDELKGVDMRFKLVRKKPSLVVNEEYLDPKYFIEKVVRSVDKKSVEADLNAGKEVDGATLVEGVSLRVYANSKGDAK